MFHKTIFKIIASTTWHFALPRKDAFMRWSIRDGKLEISQERGLRACCARDTRFVIGIRRPMTWQVLAFCCLAVLAPMRSQVTRNIRET